ncbi:MAG: hypothetical protein GY762_11440 [Proteobacteria bacterium]|nr:hypothetical protein [Pseudomonadota bacterium]
MKWAAGCLIVGMVVAFGCGKGGHGGAEEKHEDCKEPLPPCEVPGLSCEVDSAYGAACIDFVGDDWTLGLAKEACLELGRKDNNCYVEADLVHGNCVQTDYDVLCIEHEKHGEAWMFFDDITRKTCEDTFDGVFWEMCKPDSDGGPGPGPGNTGDLKVFFEFNNLPTVKVSIDVIESGQSNMEGARIEMSVTAKDPENDPIDGFLWSEDCVYAAFEPDSDLESESIVIIPTASEECTTAVKVFSTNSYVKAYIALNIDCVIVYEPIEDGPDLPISQCSLQNACVPTQDPCLGLVCGSAVDECGLAHNCGSCGVNETCSASQTSCLGCIPESPSVTCGSRVCGTVVNDCGQTVACGTCGGETVCAADQLSCEEPGCPQWSCAYANNNDAELDQCDELVGGISSDETAAEAHCSSFMIGGMFPPTNPHIICGDCESYLTSQAAVWGGYCDFSSGNVTRGYSENLQATPADDCDASVLYTAAWACSLAVGSGPGVFTCVI